MKLLKKFKVGEDGQEEDNFFLEDEPDKDDKGYEQINMDDEGNLVEVDVPENRQDKDAEKGYFLQPICASRLKSKIYLYDNLVQDMNKEFRDRLQKKRKIINSMKRRCKEMALKDVTLLCDRCEHEVSLLKTINYISDDMHHAKCVFGQLRRVEIKDALNNADGLYQDQDNKDFIDIYMEIWGLSEEEMKKSKHDPNGVEKYAFSECRNHHLVGIVDDQKFYFTDVS